MKQKFHCGLFCVCRLNCSFIHDEFVEVNRDIGGIASDHHRVITREQRDEERRNPVVINVGRLMTSRIQEGIVGERQLRAEWRAYGA